MEIKNPSFCFHKFETGFFQSHSHLISDESGIYFIRCLLISVWLGVVGVGFRHSDKYGPSKVASSYDFYKHRLNML